MPGTAVIRKATRRRNETREFVARQFALEFQSGATLAAAAQKLRAALPDDHHWAIVEIETTFSGAEETHKASALARLMRVAQAKQVSPERTFVAYEDAVRGFRPGISLALAGARTLGVYLAVLLLLLMIVVGTYALFVLPQFAAIYYSFGAPLPRFTTVMIGNIWLPVIVLALVILCGTALFIGLSRLKRRLLALAPVGPLLRRIPGLAHWATAHDTALWTLYQSMLLDAGTTPADARASATALVGEPADVDRLQFLDCAARLGHLPEELSRQIEQHRTEALASLEGPRNAFVLLLRLAIYILVALYVLAMYLPIFKLGAVI
jgi:hypothetical protein